MTSNKLFDFVGKNSAELTALNESLQDLLDGIQVMRTRYCLFMFMSPHAPLAICSCFVML